MKQFVGQDLKIIKQQYRSLELHICVSEVVSDMWNADIQEHMANEHNAVQSTEYKVGVVVGNI
jgi:hypothetical protein